MIFHRHKWVEDGAKYTPPYRIDPVSAFWDTSIYTLTRWDQRCRALGFTTLRQKCADCGYVKVENVIGNATKK